MAKRSVQKTQELPPSEPKGRVYDTALLSRTPLDPISQAIHHAWRNRQQHGRMAYEQMLKDTTVSVPFDTLLDFIKAIRIDFQAPQQDPTATQKLMAEFLNAQLSRIEWTKFVDGLIGQGYQFGFSLAEITTVLEPWRGRPYIQLDRLTVLPQSSLDAGGTMYTNTLNLANVGPTTYFTTYTCFDIQPDGSITGYHQYRSSKDDPRTISWVSPEDMGRILHFKHRGGDGNPFGQSMLFSAFDDWADHYLLSRQEQFHVENSLPYLTASYEGDEPRPAFHDELTKTIQKNGPEHRLLTANNAKFGKVTQSDPDYAAHAESRMKRLEAKISYSMRVPLSLYRETGENDLDTRNLTQTFLKFTLPSLLNEILEFITNQFGKRFVDANFSNVSAEDYPKARYRFTTPNDLRLASGVLQMLMPHLDSEKLGLVASHFMEGFEPEWVARDPEMSVGVVRQGAIAAAGAEAQGVADGTSTPPPKEEGETRTRTEGDVESVGQVTSTSS